MKTYYKKYRVTHDFSLVITNYSEAPDLGEQHHFCVLEVIDDVTYDRPLALCRTLKDAEREVSYHIYYETSRQHRPGYDTFI